MSIESKKFDPDRKNNFCKDNSSNYYLKIILKNILKTMVNHGNMVSLPWLVYHGKNLPW